MPTLTSDDILRGLNVARDYGHIPCAIIVPRSYDAPAHVDGVSIDYGEVNEPTIVTTEDARLNFHGHAINE